ncbi:6-bladed beta-propeller [Ramlibacter sp. RBP-2]|uniref:6-bladed beta-propeller n=1 Tax=Ramlibacter lithotrophicus TaxID=2606681 RepID=A0A7X6I718_9BURK|nr:6-bladed beta-propeller [Ramlibacter lithotrophicus]NKE66835.1 6-bladed beta-propeller [Ramlibacter lithotrophicus]
MMWRVSFVAASRLLCLCVLGVLGACAPVLVEPADPVSLVWPDEIDVPPRIAFVKEFSRPNQLGITRNFFQRIGDLILGASEVRLIRPMAVVAVKGVVYVADPGAKGVHRFDPTKGRYDLIAGPAGTELPSPVGLAQGEAGEVYVTDSQLAQVLVIRPGAKTAAPLALASMMQPTGVAFDPEAGRLLVVDTGAHRVNLFNRDGTLHSSFGGRGTGNGAFNYPTLLWRDNRGRLYVTDSLNFRIQVFDAAGTFMKKFGQLGDGPGDNSRQKGIATDSWGHVYVVDALFNALQIFDGGGQLLLSVGTIGSGPGEFWLPAGIFIGDDNLIYIADSYNRRVQILRYIGGPT